MKRLIDMRSGTLDKPAVGVLHRKMLKWSLRKHGMAPGGLAVILETYRLRVAFANRGSSGGYTHRKGQQFANFSSSCNIPLLGRHITYFREYAHFIKDNTIGAFSYKHPEAHIYALAAHEIAHVVHKVFHAMQDGRQKMFGISRRSAMHLELDNRFQYGNSRSYAEAHGREWQTLYAELREKYVNHLDIVFDIGKVIK